jgi:parvulin-like peptidyl-prolyl isomerase/predicted nucleic acid-binding protein
VIAGSAGPGLHYRLPWPVDRVDIVAVNSVRRAEAPASLMLTGDENLITVRLSIHYTVTDPAAFLLNIVNPEAAVLQAVDSAMRQVVANEGVDALLTVDKSAIQQRAAALTQTALDRYEAGLQAVGVQPLESSPPPEVAEAFRDVASAREDRNTFINEALAYQDVIATFDSGQLTITDVEAHLKVLVPEEYLAVARTPETLLAVVEDLVMNELVRRWATTRQPDRDEDFSHTMQHITESLNLESLDAQRHEGEIQIAESEIQDYYDANREQFGDQSLNAVREQIREILVAEREQGYIEGYLKRLKDNASIARNVELLDVPAPAEDDLRRYYDANMEQFRMPRRVVEVAGAITNTLALTGTTYSEGARDPAWDAAVFALTANELSDVFRAGDVFYIVRLNELQPARTQTLEEVRPIVMTAVEQQQTETWFTANASKTLFVLKGKQYTLGQFYKEFKEFSPLTPGQYAGPEGMKQLAEQLIERLLLVEDTYDQLLDVQNKPLVDEARLQVLKQMLHQEEIDDQIQPTDEELQKFYDENLDQMVLPSRARIRYIRVGLGSTEDEQNVARARADEAYRKLAPGFFQPGADFAAVAQEYSEDPETAANGGELEGWIGESEDILAEAQLHPFHEAILPLLPNEISQPIQFGDSLYIVQVIERTEPEQLTFEQAKPDLEETLTGQKHEERQAQLTDELFKQNNVVIYESVLVEYFNTLSSPAAPFDSPTQ